MNIRFNIKLINPIFLNWINGLLNKLEPVNNFQLYQDFFKNIKDNIENNSALLKFKNVQLYQHQKESQTIRMSMALISKALMLVIVSEFVLF